LSETAETATPAAPPASLYDRPYEVLMARGWKPLGPPGWPQTRWLSPYLSHNPLGHYTKVPVLMPDPETGQDVPLMVKDGSPAQRRVMAMQTVFTPPAEPESLRSAIEVEILRNESAYREKASAPGRAKETLAEAVEEARALAEQAGAAAARVTALAAEAARLAAPQAEPDYVPPEIAATDAVRAQHEAQREAEAQTQAERAAELAHEAEDRDRRARGMQGLPPFARR
jgi:hypothetical protein